MLKDHFIAADRSADLKLVILIECVALIVGNWIDGPYAEVFFIVMLVVSYQSFCGYLSNYHFLVSCSLLAVPNLGFALFLSAVIYHFGEVNDWVVFLWLGCTSFMGIASLVLAWFAKARGPVKPNVESLRFDA